METFSVQACWPQDVTVLANIFLDEYMPKANGEFVKIYLYLLRSSGAGTSLSLSAIADRMNCTETDVLRALRYWNEAGVLQIDYREDGMPGRITIVNFCGPAACVPRKEEAVPAEAEIKPGEANPSGSLTRGRIGELSSKEDVQEFLFIAEQYMGRPLTKTELEKLLYFYDGLHFPPDLIDFLLEHCISRGHKSIRYIEKVALAWDAEGIRSVEAARDFVTNNRREYYAVLKALGITNRALTTADITMIDKWMKTWEFPEEVVLEACRRAVLRTSSPSLTYTDGIISGWHRDGAKTLEEIARLDSLREASADRKKNENTPAAQRPRKKPAGNFYNFEQRSYDYRKLEAQLLGNADTDES
ncbi:MAG: DnaD domain protein [Lachnospiraceae bacterium]|nr:DnaD domain protein [Lachnospiraceae bacterium]